MKYNKIKKIMAVAVILSISSVPVIAHASTTTTTTSITQSTVKITSNWLTKEVANQLNKTVGTLTEQDFLKIKNINLQNTSINSEIPQEIQLLKNLEYLNLHNSKVTGQVPSYIGTLTKLTYLDLSNNTLTSLPTSVKEKIRSAKYTYCDVSGNSFKLDKGWSFLKGKWYYVDTNGTFKTGWLKDTNGKWYYLDSSGVMKTGWLKDTDGKWYFLTNSGAMKTGWFQSSNGKWYYFATSGAMQTGWINPNDTWYYLNSSGVMITGDQTIGGKKYRFDNSGALLTNIWLDSSTYVQANGYSVNPSSSMSHSNTNYKLFKYMTDVNNEWSVDSAAIALHGGDTSNNCVYFASESLRRIGVNIPTYTANTYQLESQLLNRGWKTNYDLSQLKTGDIILTNGYTHAYTFMYWDTDGYAYVVDNQASSFDNKVLHRRQIYKDTETTDRASHFFYAPY